jgi:uncharacterized protein (TIGR02118 family)
MHKFVVLYGQPESPEDFKKYYVDKHVPLAATLPGLRAYRYTFEVMEGRKPAKWFCVFEGEFDSAEAMGEAMSSDIGKAVNADVPNYASGGATVIHYTPIGG